MERIAIIDGLRTPFCKMGTSFNDVSAQELAAIATREFIERRNFDTNIIDEVIFGNVSQPPEAANIARVIFWRYSVVPAGTATASGSGAAAAIRINQPVPSSSAGGSRQRFIFRNRCRISDAIYF